MAVHCAKSNKPDDDNDDDEVEIKSDNNSTTNIQVKFNARQLN